MNKRQIIASLNKITNQLDLTGLHKEASTLTNVMKRLVTADEFNISDEPSTIQNNTESSKPKNESSNNNENSEIDKMREQMISDVLQRKIFTRSLRQGLEDLGEQITVQQYLNLYAGNVKRQIDQLTNPDKYNPDTDVQKQFDYFLNGTLNNIKIKLEFLDIPTAPALYYFKTRIAPLQKYLEDKIKLQASFHI
jgi:hypothetical protein